MASSTPIIHVVYATVTGTASDLAFSCANLLAQYSSVFAAHVLSIDEITILELPRMAFCVYIISTTGDGDMPPSASDLWKFLLRSDLPAGALSRHRYALFAVGDSSYIKFNAAGRKLDTRLQQLGALPFCTRCLGDEQSAMGIYADMDAWLTSKLIPALSAFFPAMQHVTPSNHPQLMQCRFEVQLCEGGESPLPSALDALHPLHDRDAYPTPTPTACVVRSCHRMTAAGHDQDVRHVQIDTSGTAVVYDAGDVAVIFPANPPATVAALLKRLRLAAADTLRISPAASSIQADDKALDERLSLPQCRRAAAIVAPHTRMCSYPSQVTAGTLFSRLLDINGRPKRAFLLQCALFARDDEQRDKLIELASASGVDLYHTYITRARRSYVDVLVDFDSVHIPVAFLLEIIPPLQPREYSIASALPGELHLCVAIVAYTAAHGRAITGTASAWIASRASGDDVILRVRRGTMRLPSPPTGSSTPPPVILIGPGTGIAPMRSLIQHARATCSGHAITLLCGFRRRDSDWLYGDEMTAWTADAAAAPRVYDVAFSRDQERKVYVQTLIREKHKAAIVRALVHQDGVLFIAGSAKRMPSDVLDTLRACIAEVEGIPPADAAKLVARLERSRRIIVEAWS